jgi:hypothetical protein
LIGRRQRRKSAPWLTVWCIATIALVLLSCGPDKPRPTQKGQGSREPGSASGTAGAKKTWDQALAVATCEEGSASSPDAVLAESPPQEVHVYLDGSVSMKPFAGQGSRFSDVIAALRPALLDLGIRRSRVFRLGEGLESLAQSGGFERFDEPGFYSRGETNLAAALDAEAQSTAAGSLAVVVTDGVMSLRRDVGKPGEIGECEQGSDVDCLSLKIARLIESGRGFWLVGVRSAFRGILFSEKAQVGGASLGHVEVPNRPFYVWVISDHPPTARAFIQKILRRISVAPNGTEAFALELAPGDLPWRLPESSQAPDPDGAFLPVNVRNGAVRGKFLPANSGKAPTQVVSQQGLTGSGFALRIPLRATALEKIPDGLTPAWRYQSGYCMRWEGGAPRGTLQVRVAEGDGALHWGILTPSFEVLSKRHATLVQRLERPSVGQDLVTGLAAWSTRDDRTVQMASRTLNLGNFLEALQERLNPPERYEQPILVLNFQ